MSQLEIRENCPGNLLNKVINPIEKCIRNIIYFSKVAPNTEIFSKHFIIGFINNQHLSDVVFFSFAHQVFFGKCDWKIKFGIPPRVIFRHCGKLWGQIVMVCDAHDILCRSYDTFLQALQDNWLSLTIFHNSSKLTKLKVCHGTKIKCRQNQLLRGSLSSLLPLSLAFQHIGLVRPNSTPDTNHRRQESTYGWADNNRCYPFPVSTGHGDGNCCDANDKPHHQTKNDPQPNWHWMNSSSPVKTILHPLSALFSIAAQPQHEVRGFNAECC